jgi:hypothetical protein
MLDVAFAQKTEQIKLFRPGRTMFRSYLTGRQSAVKNKYGKFSKWVDMKMVAFLRARAGAAALFTVHTRHEQNFKTPVLIPHLRTWTYNSTSNAR